MVTSNFGTSCAYDSNKEDWQSYVERLELFFTTNDVNDAEKKRAILLTSCGIETCWLFKALTAPGKPVEETFNKLIISMANHKNPKRNPIAERFQFNMHNRKAGETVSQYMAELHRLSQYCEYGKSLDNMLRDRLVCGINHDRMQQRLLSEGSSLSLEKAIDISLSLESAIKQAAVIQSEFNQPSEAVSKFEQKISRSQGTKCFRCDTLHNPKSCPFIDKQCFFCGNKGHTFKVCRKKARSNQSHVVKQSSNVVIETIPSENSKDDVFSIYQLRNSNPSTLITVFITIANHKLPIEVDTGASISFLNWNTFQKLNCKSNISLLPTKTKLKMYSGEIVSPKGQAKIEFLFEGKKIKTTFLITNEQSPNVLGRDILEII